MLSSRDHHVIQLVLTKNPSSLHLSSSLAAVLVLKLTSGSFAPLGVCDHSLIGPPSCRGLGLAPASPKTLHLLTCGHSRRLLSFTSTTIQNQPNYSITNRLTQHDRLFYDIPNSQAPDTNGQLNLKSFAQQATDYRSRRDQSPLRLYRHPPTKHDVLPPRGWHSWPGPNQDEQHARLDSFLPRVLKHALPQGGQGCPTPHVPVPDLPAH